MRRFDKKNIGISTHDQRTASIQYKRRSNEENSANDAYESKDATLAYETHMCSSVLQKSGRFLTLLVVPRTSDRINEQAE